MGDLHACRATTTRPGTCLDLLLWAQGHALQGTTWLYRPSQRIIMTYILTREEVGFPPFRGVSVIEAERYHATDLMLSLPPFLLASTRRVRRDEKGTRRSLVLQGYDRYKSGSSMTYVF